MTPPSGIAARQARTARRTTEREGTADAPSASKLAGLDRGPSLALPRSTMMLLLIILLVLALLGGGLGYGRYGAVGLSPAVIVGLILVILLVSGRL
jgi:hypothetical protein